MSPSLWEEARVCLVCVGWMPWTKYLRVKSMPNDCYQFTCHDSWALPTLGDGIVILLPVFVFFLLAGMPPPFPIVICVDSYVDVLYRLFPSFFSLDLVFFQGSSR